MEKSKKCLRFKKRASTFGHSQDSLVLENEMIPFISTILKTFSNKKFSLKLILIHWNFEEIYLLMNGVLITHKAAGLLHLFSRMNPIENKCTQLALKEVKNFGSVIKMN